MSKLGSRPVGLAEAIVGEIDVLRPRRGRAGSGSSSATGRGFRFSPRANQLWRFALGSNAAVLKKIGKGGTASAGELAAQMDYLFSKSAAIFGNGVVLDDKARGLTREERKEIVGDWVEGWRGSPKNGHTTHLLLSFPSHVRPDKAKLIAEAWAFEMFQSGEHQEDAWFYVAALHTDRAHPHVHVVVNNRGALNDSWFFMAKDHVFNLDTMKARMVAIAAEEGVFLDATSRAERGILTYGPSRAEIERARVEGRRPQERPREGRALDEALATLDRSAGTMRTLTQVAALTGLPEIADRIARAEEGLRRGGMVPPFPMAGVSAGRADLERHFSEWMSDSGNRIRKAPALEHKALREEFHDYAEAIARGLGDVRSAELMRMKPQTVLYGTVLSGEVLESGDDRIALRPGAADRLRTEIVASATALGLSGERMARRLETGAGNAWEERDWVKADIFALASSRRLDLADPEQGQRLAADLQNFYERAAQAIGQTRAREIVPENDRLVRTLRAMARIMQADGRVEFRDDEQAGRFATELRERYGDGIVKDLANGRTGALERDIPEDGQRIWIARALVAASTSHAMIGLTLREAVRAMRELGDHANSMGLRDNER